ncbi:MAG: type IV secretory system conjugative DNA transfer family protein, partial [Candidatus Obscuribacterales bacterium]|nr:type IV secretory system conjugative DNA transfer family protein [Candidatus Obscuribacterales bacterium]
EDAPTTVIKPPIGEATDADGGETEALFQAHKDQLEDFFGPQESGKSDSSGFFGEEQGEFDFFSGPANPAARRAQVLDELEERKKSEEAQSAAAVQSDAAIAEAQPQPGRAIESSGVQERPRVAIPKSITQSATKLKVTPNESGDEEQPSVKSIDAQKDDSDGDGEGDSTYKPPKRRSFSGDGGSATKATPAKSKKNKSDDDDDDDDTISSDENWLEKDVRFCGLTVSRKTAAVLVTLGVFIAVQVPGWFMSFANVVSGGAGPGGSPTQTAHAPTGGGTGFGLPGAQSPQGMQPPGMLPGMNPPGMQPGTNPGMQSQPGVNPGAPGQQPATFSHGIPVIAGKWMIETKWKGQVIPSVLILNQQGVGFSGQGQDGFGTYDVQSGALSAPDVIQFYKKYDQESRHKNNAHNEFILYQGKWMPEGKDLVMVGAFRTQEKVGSSFSTLKPQKIITLTGPWRARLSGGGAMAQGTGQAQGQLPMPPVAVAPPPQLGFPIPGLGGPKPFETGPTAKSGPDAVRNFFLLIALGVIAICVIIILFSLELFGPSGKMNIWEKQKYIPSQFRPDHMKMVRELGRPLKAGGVPLGQREEWRWWTFWQPKFLSMPNEIRKQNPHFLFIGGGDKGKTRLMASMITYDIKSEDRGVVVIDSDGQLCDLITEWIASQPDGAKYAKRVVVVDPTYKAGSLAYNPLEMPDDGDLQAAASAIVHGFKAIYTEPPGAQSQWNPQTANILRNAALLLMANGRTLVDLPNLLQDNDFRDIMLETVERKKSEKTEYNSILEQWNQYKKLARTDQWITWVEPILNRVGPMLSDGRIRPILTKPVSDLKLKEIILKKRILIVKVPQGELDQNANLLGSLLVTGLQQAAMSLGKGKHVERPVSLYLDEMDSFVEKETIENISSETKRYQIAFIGCIKTLQHLPEDYRNQLVINMGTMAIFALSKKDGDMLGPQMFRVDGRKIKHQTIQNFFNKVNTSPQFELIMDEEKLNIDRIVGQEVQTYFLYRVGTVAGVFKLKAFDFKDIPERKINKKLVEKMHAISDSFDDKKKGKKDKDGDAEE